MNDSPATRLRTQLGASLPDSTALEPVRALAFWIAVVLPFLYVPLLATGLGTPATTQAFLLLLGANAVALLVGHPYLRD